jgi:hypothetical protein
MKKLSAMVAMMSFLVVMPVFAAITGIFGAAGSTRSWYYDVPAGLSSVQVSISGGAGDCDMYLKYGAVPTTTSYTYRPYLSGNNESVTIPSPATGRLYIMLRGYSAYSGVTLNVLPVVAPARVATPTFSPSGGTYNSPQTVTIASGTSGATIRYTTSGAEPTASSAQYSNSILIQSTTTIKAKAFKAGMGDSYTATAVYIINPPAVTVLGNGQALSGRAGSANSVSYFKITVPVGQSSLLINMGGGSGDGDLYVKRGSLPTTTSYDFRPYLGGNNEAVTINSPASGDYYIMLRGYTAFSGVTLTATYKATSVVDQAMQNAVNNLGKISGNVIWNGVIQYGVWVNSPTTYCARFSRMCYGEPYRFDDAISMYNWLNSCRVISAGTIAPRGALVFYAAHSSNGSYGHVGIADGAGKTYSVTSLTTGVTLKPVIGTFAAAYLGYCTAENFIAYH